MNQKKFGIFCFIFFLLQWAPFFVFSAVKVSLAGPSEKNFLEKTNNDNQGENFLINIYQTWISPVRGTQRCPMYPSCSQYAKIAFNSLPFPIAYIKTTERLLNCGHDLHFYPAIMINNKKRWYDPVSPNTFDFFSQRVYNQFKYFEIHYFNGVNSQKSNEKTFADFLFKHGEYEGAITEYFRALYTARDSIDIQNYYRNIGKCYYLNAQYNQTITFFNSWRETFQTNSDMIAEMDLFLAKSYYQLGNYKKAIATLQWFEKKPNNQLFNETQFVLGLSYARLYNWQAAKENLQQINKDYPQMPGVQNLLRAFSNASQLNKKNPTIAGIFSVIPGAGYLYCGKKRTAFTAFIINSLFFWAIRDAVVHKQYGIATTAGFLGIGWYVGNIKGSVDAALSHNSRIQHQYINDHLAKEGMNEFIKQ